MIVIKYKISNNIFLLFITYLCNFLDPKNNIKFSITKALPSNKSHVYIAKRMNIDTINKYNIIYKMYFLTNVEKVTKFVWANF